MSVLCIGLSHHGAPVELLERAVLSATDGDKLLEDLMACPTVAEAFVVSTCNRVEVYAEVEMFHAGLQEVSLALARATGLAADELTAHLYVHYEDRAVHHLFTVTSGLDSMVVGESQILGQLRAAFRVARDAQTVGRSLGSLLPHALRTGKRVHAETGIDQAGRSLVSVGLDLARATLGALEGRPSLVVGAGSIGALVGASLRRAGVTDVTVVNRTAANAWRLADEIDGRARPLAELAEAMAGADLIVSCTGASGVVIGAEDVAISGRSRFFLDLALPRDVDPAVRDLPGVTVADLETLRVTLEARGAGTVAADVDAARRIVVDEVAAYLAARRSARVAPTVAALRSKAADVVDTELLRLAARLPDLDDRARREVAATVRRVVDKLLHAPTVRVKELAEAPGGDAYAEALRELFGLDPAGPAAVILADVTLPGSPESR
ncbi:MAG TPA: glutamyl-tRNA reductase [Mycobacteriales bacterium]|nr:glutamyl-tRNA reductase [Mycobacteriales bacterium]